MAGPTPFSETLYRSIDRAESLLLVSLLAGGVMYSFGISQGSSVVTIALGGLAAVFFLMAYRPPTLPAENTSQKMDFMHLLIKTIVPKVLWISCAIGVAGLLMRHLQTPNDGYKQLLIIQLVTTGATLIVAALAAIQGVSGVRKLMPIYFRALPISFAAVSLLMA